MIKLLLQVMMVATFKLNKTNFAKIKISLMLLLQVMMDAIFKYTVKFTDSSDINDVSIARNDGHHIEGHHNQAHNKNLLFSNYF